MDIARYMADNWDTLQPQIVTHLKVVVIAVAVAAAAGIPAGVVAARSPRFAAGAIAVTSVILTLPSFALFGALTILFGIGNLPVECGLTLYALLPILRNTRTGVLAVEAAVVEAAQGIGMTPRQLLLAIELPLALPLVVAGVRQSTVLVVAVATVGAAVGSNNLGQPIFEGIRGTNRDAIFSGAIPVAAMGIALDAALAGLERALGRARLGALLQ